MNKHEFVGCKANGTAGHNPRSHCNTCGQSASTDIHDIGEGRTTEGVVSLTGGGGWGSAPVINDQRSASSHMAAAVARAEGERQVKAQSPEDLADEAALAFIQNNGVKIETDGNAYRALVRAFLGAYRAGQLGATPTPSKQEKQLFQAVLRVIDDTPRSLWAHPSQYVTRATAAATTQANAQLEAEVNRERLAFADAIIDTWRRFMREVG